MATWVNLLDIIYPAGSLYISRNSTSPASIVGGTWTQIKGAVLAATGANGFAAQGYGGNLAMTVYQMPTHTHGIKVQVNATTHSKYVNALTAAGYAWTNYYLGPDEEEITYPDWSSMPDITGGGKTFCLTTTEYTSGIELHNFFASLGGDLIG